MQVLKTTIGEVLDLAFSSDNRAVAAAVESQGVFLWNLDSPNLAPVRLEFGGKYRAGGLHFAGNTRQLTWQLFDGRRTYNRDTRNATTETFAILESVTAWRLCAGGSRLLSNHGMPDHFLAGWEWKEGEWVRQWRISTESLSIGMVTPSLSGEQFAMFTRATESKRWWEQPMQLEIRDTATSEVCATGSYRYSYAGKLAFHPNSSQIVGINNMTLLAWSLPAVGDPRRVQNDNYKHFTALAYHPNGNVLFVTSNDETVHVFDTHTLTRVNRYTWQLNRLSAVTVSSDGTLAAAGSANGDIVVWDLD